MIGVKGSKGKPEESWDPEGYVRSLGAFVFSCPRQQVFIPEAVKLLSMRRGSSSLIQKPSRVTLRPSGPAHPVLLFSIGG